MLDFNVELTSLTVEVEQVGVDDTDPETSWMLGSYASTAVYKWLFDNILSSEKTNFSFNTFPDNAAIFGGKTSTFCSWFYRNNWLLTGKL